MSNTSLRPYLWKKQVLALLLSLALLGLGSPGVLQAQPESMSSNSYMIQLGNFNMTGGEKSSTSYTVTDTVGQTAPGQYDGTGYVVYAGFQYLYTLSRFSFRILDLSIDLGEVMPETFANDSHQLVISTRTSGYTILARARNHLRRPGGPGQPFVPFTSCDVSCSISTAGIWIDPLKTGLGFSVTGTHKASDFVDATYFRPFANMEGAENAQTIATHTSVVKDDVITVSYRLSVSQTQAAGNYSTSIDYTALPSY